MGSKKASEQNGHSVVVKKKKKRVSDFGLMAKSGFKSALERDFKKDIKFKKGLRELFDQSSKEYLDKIINQLQILKRTTKSTTGKNKKSKLTLKTLKAAIRLVDEFRPFATELINAGDQAVEDLKREELEKENEDENMQETFKEAHESLSTPQKKQKAPKKASEPAEKQKESKKKKKTNETSSNGDNQKKKKKKESSHEVGDEQTQHGGDMEIVSQN